MSLKFSGCLWLLFLLATANLYSQNFRKDSLLKVVKSNLLDSGTVSAYLNLGSLYKSERDSSQSADNYFKALNLSKKIDFKRGIIVSLTEIGYLAEVTQDLPKAKFFYHQAVQFGKKNNLRKQLALAYSYMYFIYSAKSEFSTAITYADSAYTIFVQLNRKADMANQLNNIGTCYWKLNKNLEAIKYYQKTLSIIDELGDDAEPKKLNTFLNIGLVFEDLKSHDQATKYFKKVIPLAKKYQLTKSLRDAYNNLGNVYLNTKQYQKALYYYKLSLPLALKSDDAEAKGIAYGNIATSLINLKRYEEAEESIKLSDKEYQSIGNKEGIASNLVNYAQLLAETKKINEADIALKKAMQIANKNNFVDIKQSVFESMAEVSKLKGEFTDAYIKQDSAYQLQNKNYNVESNRQIADLEVKYRTAEKEREILKNRTQLLVADAKIEKRNYWLIIASVSVLLLAFGAFLIYRNSILKQQKLKEEAVYKVTIAQEQTKNQIQEEKLRISRELHDNIGAQLSFINGSIQSLASADSENQQLQQTQQVTRNTIKELRSTVWLINQQEFDLDTFVVKLREYLKPYYGSKPLIDIQNQSDKDYILEPIMATNLFRIMQELVNNALKYSEANELLVNVNAEQNMLNVTVQDDGIGYDSNAKPTGYGLKNIETRVKAISGNYKVDTSIGSGTKFHLSIPI
ncbi:tetratricopeptide repeat-containing sensor histidine kinase [Pedobacter arcticus]|uniref:tetratricopeptide repeat-containing sensor histidine kinase n=1 Tax=Pedobacter arcticus TaxID=752140 RepID=UPI0003096DC7|nr:sensor histidine kinase [Pedobacter arcticus]